MEKSPKGRNIDVVIFGAGIAGLWTFHALKKRGYDVLLLERDEIGCGQTLASQGIIHSGLKFSLAGKVSSLAKTISAMPDRWREALDGKGNVDLSQAQVNAQSQHLMIPPGFFGGLTKIVTQKALGESVRSVPQKEWSADVQSTGFKGSVIFMNEPVLDVPSVLRALATPYIDCIKKIGHEEADAPFDFLKKQNITAKQIIFTSAKSNHNIAQYADEANGLETQHRPLLQGMLRGAPFDLFAHLVGKTDKPVASITTHKTENGERVWYLGGGVAERAKDTNPDDVYRDALAAFKSYLPQIDFSDTVWATLPIDRVEGKSNTDGWMPDTPTIHHGKNALYCWPTKLTFAPLLYDMIQVDLDKKGISPSCTSSDFSDLPQAAFAKPPWDKCDWVKL